MHTEGPWQSQHDFDMEGVCRIIGAIDGPDDGRFHYRVVCEIDPDGSLDAKEQYANARLIAAAPDLYEALKPFAAMASAGDQRPKDDAVWAGQDGLRITYGDFRRALAALSKASQQQGSPQAPVAPDSEAKSK